MNRLVILLILLSAVLFTAGCTEDPEKSTGTPETLPVLRESRKPRLLRKSRKKVLL